MRKICLLGAKFAALLVEREVSAGVNGQGGMADQNDQQQEQPLIAVHSRHGSQYCVEIRAK